MADYITTNIRNIALIGHGSEGKTTLTEAMLYAAGLVDRQGRVEDGTTVTDFEPEEEQAEVLHQRRHRPCRLERQDCSTSSTYPAILTSWAK